MADGCRNLQADFVALFGPYLASPACVRLNSREQERVATWAVKVALLLEIYTEALGHGAYVPVDNLRWLADHRDPPPGTCVWLTGLHTENQHVHWSLAGSFPPDPGEHVAYLATFTICCLGVQIFGRDDAHTEEDGPWWPVAPLDPAEPFAEASVRIWPRVDVTVDWQPREVITRDGLRPFASRPMREVPRPSKELQ